MKQRMPRPGFGDDCQTCDLCHDWHEPARYNPVLGMTVCGKCRIELENEPERECDVHPGQGCNCFGGT